MRGEGGVATPHHICKREGTELYCLSHFICVDIWQPVLLSPIPLWDQTRPCLRQAKQSSPSHTCFQDVSRLNMKPKLSISGVKTCVRSSGPLFPFQAQLLYALTLSVVTCICVHTFSYLSVAILALQTCLSCPGPATHPSSLSEQGMGVVYKGNNQLGEVAWVARNERSRALV